MRRLPWMLVCFAPAALAGQEQSVAIRDAPTAVLHNVTARFPKAKVAGVVRETEDGKQTYEVTLKQDGRNIDVSTTQSGQLVLIEREISRRELPAAVTRAIAARYPRATYRFAEAVTNVAASVETLGFYEVLIATADKQLLEVKVAADGSSILKVERKKSNDPDR